jgi:uncharacterized protein
MVDGVANICSMKNNCCQYFVVEYNGDIYPCDFFVDESLKLGNVLKTPFEELMVSSKYRDFGMLKAQWSEQCRQCDCLDFCAGDCLKHRIYHHNPPGNLSWLCDGWKQFYDYTRSRIEKLAERVIEKRNSENRLSAQKMGQARSKRPSVGRNEPCPCGSGRKYKKCCGV